MLSLPFNFHSALWAARAFATPLLLIFFLFNYAQIPQVCMVLCRLTRSLAWGAPCPKWKQKGKTNKQKRNNPKHHNKKGNKKGDSAIRVTVNWAETREFFSPFVWGTAYFINSNCGKSAEAGKKKSKHYYCCNLLDQLDFADRQQTGWYKGEKFSVTEEQGRKKTEGGKRDQVLCKDDIYLNTIWLFNTLMCSLTL